MIDAAEPRPRCDGDGFVRRDDEKRPVCKNHAELLSSFAEIVDDQPASVPSPVRRAGPDWLTAGIEHRPSGTPGARIEGSSGRQKNIHPVLSTSAATPRSVGAA
jgi:hypothetical protein